jgi:beta-galactosidase
MLVNGMKWIGLALAALAFTNCLAAETAASPRIRIRFDDNWRFRRDALPNPTDANFKWTWKQADKASLDLQSLPDDLDKGDWRATRVGRDVFRGRLGFAWYRAELGSGAKPPTLAIHFEQVDDNALVFLNGHRLMKHEGWSEPFDVPAGGAWNAAGPNALVVLVQNTDGPGGITGPVLLDTPKPETALDEIQPSYNDKAWRIVHLPHDYVVEGTFTPTADASHGSLPVTTAWYRKAFTLPATYKSKSVWIDFDGIYRKSTVYLNGHKLGTWPSGYAGFRYGINRYANFGGRNLLAVRVDPRQQEGWWYEGGGIYRHVWLNAADTVHVRPWGTYVRTDVPSFQQADVRAQTTIDNTRPTDARVVVVTRILGPNGLPIATNRTTVNVPANGHLDVPDTIHVAKPTLWSIESPRLYALDTTLMLGGAAIDHVQTSFGIRSFYYDANLGFFLNGKRVELKGTCNHQDHAGVGIAMPDGLLEWRVARLKEMGSNAYRCSHNPPTSELLDACDRLGMVVMDETRHLGDTQNPKTSSGTGTSDLSELRSLILRDRNHPSVIMWSLFNEEGLQGTPEGAAIFTVMRNAVRALDTTRPCTGAMNGGWGQGVTLVQDIQGFNYGIGGYDRMHTTFPQLPMYGSETASTVTTRGIYANDAKLGYVGAYDIQYRGVGWGANAEDSWSAIAKRPWMAGEFVWTGFDYKGEPTPYGWPCINSHFGIMDICGFPKDNFFYYQAWWGNKPVVHVLPHWNWRGKEGQPIDVWVYSNCPTVELSLNGKSLGMKPMPAYGHIEWKVPYQAGSLTAKGYGAAKQVLVTDEVDTAGAPAAIRLRTTRKFLLADEEDLAPIEVEIVDAKGRVVPTADNQVQFSVTGPGAVVGVGNGDPSSHEPDKATQRHAFNGLCMALLGGSKRPGAVTVHASSPGLQSASLTMPSR